MPLIFDIKRFAVHDGPGIRTTVFFKGCPLKCAWCHNPESISNLVEEYSQTRTIDGKVFVMNRKYGTRVSTAELVKELQKDQVFFEESKGGVTVSGGEPLMQHTDLLELLHALKQSGIHTAVDTTGYTRKEILDSVLNFTDLFLYDLKSLDDIVHRMYTGVSNKLILENADMLLDRGKQVIFRIPVVPGVNDSEEDIRNYTEFFAQRKEKIKEIHLLPYHKIGQEKYRRMEKRYSINHIKEPSTEEVYAIKNIIATSGVQVNVGG